MSESGKQHDSIIDDELIAYLDGELDATAAQHIDERLANDADLRRRLKQHQQTWDLLDELPLTNVGERFTQTTVEMVAVSMAEQVDDAAQRETFRSKITWLVGGSVAVVALVTGYAFVSSITSAPNRQLVEDLRVIEHLDEYRAIEDVEFLRALQQAGLFTAEVDDEL
jgi:anti-sigma factor RsiW